MPLYEYQCEECNSIFEVSAKMSDPPPEGHECGSKKVKRVLSLPQYRLKGDGWHLGDYTNHGHSGGVAMKRKGDDS